MELWFWAALGGAVFAGLSNFYFKQAAMRGYNAELFSMYGALISIPLVVLGLVVLAQPFWVSDWILGLMFIGGLFAALTNILKIYALKYIDATVYFPLFKLLAPGLAIIFGVSFFAESFAVTEWVGLIMGLIVPLLLITKVESTRQANLMAGLLLVLITGILSASNAAFGKFATDEGIVF